MCNMYTHIKPLKDFLSDLYKVKSDFKEVNKIKPADNIFDFFLQCNLCVLSKQAMLAAATVSTACGKNEKCLSGV